VSGVTSVIRLLAEDGAVADEVTKLADCRPNGGPGIDICVLDGFPGDRVARERGAGLRAPLAVIARTEAEAFAAIAAGADDARTVDGLDLSGFIVFLDRVSLRANQRRETENRQAAIAHSEKLAALGTVVAGVAHEINNPLGVVILDIESVRSNVEPLLRAQEEIFRLAQRGTSATRDEVAILAEIAQTGAAAVDLRADLDDVDTALRTITDVARDLRILARAEAEEKPEPVYLPDLVDQVLRIVGKQITSIAALERDYGADVPTLLLPRSRVTQVLTNLLINAAHAIAEVRRPMHRVRISIRCDAEAIALSISDSGPGIAPEIVERIFDPFFTTKRADRATGGTGLGLSISRSILHDLGGDLIAESVHGEGATFIAMIPAEGRRVERPRHNVSASVSPPATRSSVLVVEDEEALLRSLATALRKRFHVLLASDGQEAIDLLRSGSRPDAILCDIALPVLNGFQLYEWLQENHPDLARHTVFMTANVTDEGASKFIARVDKPLIEKPISRERLLSVLDRVMTTA
jgi:two-component system NtrC family sensor kinase